MTTIIRLGVCLLAALVLTCPLCAADPPAGKVLLLDNERILEGDIAREGGHYRVKRSIGETWVPAETVLCVCASRAEAFRFLQARTNLADPDERLRLARWCQRYNLLSEALEEVSQAVRLRPDHKESQRLLSHLQRPAVPAEPAVPKHDVDSDDDSLPPVELTTDAFRIFATKVQPILMNACASCHATGQGGAFKLRRSVGSAPPSPRTIQHNLAAVMAQINLEQLSASPLLVKAVTVHGEAGQPPLKGRQIAAYQTLENWVRLAVLGTSQVRQPTITTALTPPSSEPSPEAAPRNVQQSTWATFAAPKPPADKPADPFDPAIFNRQMHPKP